MYKFLQYARLHFSARPYMVRIHGETESKCWTTDCIILWTATVPSKSNIVTKKIVCKFYFHHHTSLLVGIWNLKLKTLGLSNRQLYWYSNWHKRFIKECVHRVGLKIDDKIWNKLYAWKFNDHKSRKHNRGLRKRHSSE